jgi:hypothetical protein
MLVYREQRSSARPDLLLGAARTRLTDLLASDEGLHDRCVRLLIDLGALEAAVADELCPERDDLHPLLGALRSASLAAGHLVCHAWRGHRAAMAAWAERARAALGAAERHQLPRQVHLTVPEGYAYYGLYPETYLVAACRAVRTLPMPRVICVGLRTIGASLSAVVAAAVAEAGREVVSFTLRPHGHPFDRRPRLSDRLSAMVASHRTDLFLVVDEGPGLSGSSFSGVGRALEELGVPEDHIAFLPSWRTDGRALRSADARRQWGRRLQFTASFEEVWLGSRRLERLAEGRPLSDISAGRWRPRLLERDAFPPVQPQHERRKFLVHERDDRDAAPSLILRFAGLGARGDATRRRSEHLSDAGWTTPPLALAHGFLVQQYRPGTPATLQDGPSLIPIIARYLTHLRQAPPLAEPATDLTEMVRTNVTEVLGAESADRAVATLAAAAGDAAPVALDGRMLPHEWVRTEAGFFKVDNLDHHDDHFYPGPQDIAWDLAAACLELGLEADARRSLVELYRAASGDRTITARLPAYAVAYLSFRIGYATLASTTLGATPDGERFAASTRNYRRLLVRELEPQGHQPWAG